MSRKLIGLLLFICVIISFSTAGYTEDNINVAFNGTLLSFDVPPTIIDGRTMLPLRAIFEAFGAAVEWDGTEKKVKGIKGDIIVELQIDNKTARVNEKEVILDVPGTIVDERTMVPARFISESFGANVDWLAETGTVSIKYYGIDYNNPSKYLASGNQTNISENLFLEIDKQLNIKTKELADIKKVLDWKSDNFKSEPDGGKGNGKTTVNEIIESKTITGCNDVAILVSTILRKYGFPVLIVNGTGIQFSFDYPEKTKLFSGHAFLEVYVKDKWILVDSVSNEYILDYDVKNPFIPITKSIESKGYYVTFKGLDQNDSGITSLKQMTNKQIEYSKLIKENPSMIKLPSYTIKRFQQLKN